MSQGQRLYTTQEAASMLGVTDGRLRQMIVKGEAQPTAQIGGTWMFNREEIERLKSRPQRRRKS